MKTCRFEDQHYIAAGKTRAETRNTVVITGAYMVECCPFPQVDDELQYIFRMAKQWIRRWRNPFASASWFHLVMARCHPFENGNGRLVRLLASIPLLQHGYPPISISLAHRPDYYTAIGKAYEGDHSLLVKCIFEGMQETIASTPIP
ncbi:fido domain-containing protein [Gymnopilus junonius]|uniref:Fido domain-containing protein n=1 Tax=Gymnopilus junonius TaxID=109634 RepID=A0A9P5NU29_GYMJU|nr:fido domain-containing protein [Gymnopilus junonius]